jgi:Transposase DDE domain
MRKDRLAMGTISDLEGALQLVLEASAAEHGLTSGWQQRRGQVSPRQFVQTLVFGFLEDPHASLGHLARVAHAVGAHVTPQALSQRFTGAAVALLRGVLADALGLLLEAEPVAVALLQAFPGGVLLNDSTQLPLHDDWRAAWPGSGIAAALKLPTRFDLLRGGVQVDLTPARQHDSVTHLANVAAPAGSLVVEDLGYLDVGRMQRRMAAGVATVVPLRHTLVLADARGQRVHLLEWLQQQAEPVVERPVWVCGVPLRLVAGRASAETAARHRASLREAAQDHGRAPAPLALALADWIVVLTTATPEQASAAQIGLLLRLRWQVELLFKLWKDQGKLDETRGWKPERIEVEWYAKLLGLLLQHWVLLTTGWQWADRSLVKAGQTFREYARCLCLGWHDPAVLRRLLDAIAQSLAVAGRIRSHCHQHSAAFSAQSS